VKQGTARRKHVVGVDRRPARCRIGRDHGSGVRDLGEVVGDQALGHVLERQVVALGRVDRSAAARGVGGQVCKQDSLANNDPAVAMDRRRQLWRQLIDALRTGRTADADGGAHRRELPAGRRQTREIEPTALAASVRVPRGVAPATCDAPESKYALSARPRASRPRRGPSSPACRRCRASLMRPSAGRACSPEQPSGGAARRRA
jgi:hypothetical protein